jgi:hypothetical protein
MGHTAEEALAVNAANAIALSAIAYATTGIRRPDYVHLVIIYHFFVMISFSGISPFTVRRNFRATTEGKTLMERLAIMDVYTGPLVSIITVGLWVGLSLDQRIIPRVPRATCNFGMWGIFGQTIDMRSSLMLKIGMPTGLSIVLWLIVSIIYNTYKRYERLTRATDFVHMRYGPGRPQSQRRLPAGCDVDVVGDYFSSAIVNILDRHFPTLSWKIWRFKISITVRGIFICLRLGLWISLVIATENTISINQLTDENQMTYGQISALLLLVVPVGGIWQIVYRQSRRWRNYFDSHIGHNQLLYGLGGLMAFIQFCLIFSSFGSHLELAVIFAYATVGLSATIENIWSSQSMGFDRLLGNEIYPPASSFWKVWFSHHEIKIPLREELPAPVQVNDGSESRNAAIELREYTVQAERSEVREVPAQTSEGTEEAAEIGSIGTGDASSSGVELPGRSSVAGEATMRDTTAEEARREVPRSRTWPWSSRKDS